MIKKVYSLVTIFTIFIGSLTFFSYTKTKNIIQEEPYKIKKVQNFNYEPQCYAKDRFNGALLFLTNDGELYRCESDGEIYKIKNINLKVKKLYCFDENQECYFIDTKGNLYYTSLLDSFCKPTKIKGISKVKSFSIAKGYYSAVTEDGNLFMWINPKSKFKNQIPFKNLSSSVPCLISTIKDVENVVCFFHYMAVLTKSGDVYECGIKEENEEKMAEPIFRKIKNLKEILNIAIINGTNLIAISNDQIYRIGYPGIRDYRVQRQIHYTIKQISSESLNIAYVTNHGDVYLLGDSF